MNNRMKVPQAALDRWRELSEESQQLRQSIIDIGSNASAVDDQKQVGTAIPRVFYSADNFIINPSNVGTGILARMLETDDTVLSAVQFRILMITSKIGEYHHDNPEIKKFVNGYLKKMKGPTWQEAIGAILSSTAFGFSISEVNWRLNNDLQKVPYQICTYHPSTIAFEVDESGRITEDGVLQYVTQYTQASNPNNFWSKITYGYAVKNPFTTPTDRLMPNRVPFVYNFGLVRIPRNKCVHHVNLPMFSFGSPYGKTAVRTAHLAWQLKVFFMKQMGIAGKRNATPALWGTAPMNQIKLQVKQPDGKTVEMTPTEALRAMLADRETDDAVITGPEANGYKITALANAANLDQYLNVINALNVWIFRCFLLPSLVMTDGSAGSRSLGDKHFDTVDKISSADARQFGETIINDVIERSIVENFGEQDDYGHFTQRPQSIEERQRLQSMFSDGVNSGILKTYVPNDMSFMRSSLGYPEDTDPTGGVDPAADHDAPSEESPREKAPAPKEDTGDAPDVTPPSSESPAPGEEQD